MSRQRKIPIVFQALGAGLRMFRWVVLALIVLFLISGIQSVQQDNVGLLLRFGRLQGAAAGSQVKQPGAVFALPYPVDRLIEVPGPKQELQLTIDDAWKDRGAGGELETIDPLKEGYLLTGDLNVVQAKVVAKYNITAPAAYRLHTYRVQVESQWVSQAEDMIRETVLTELTRIVAATPVDDVLRAKQSTQGDDSPENATKNAGLAEVVQSRAQDRLEEIGCGVTLTSISFEQIHAPRHVYDAFESVQQQRTMIAAQRRRALGNAAQITTNAEAKKNEIVKDAEVYRTTKVAEAKGEKQEFAELYESYRKTPDTVWQNLHLETVERCSQKIGKLLFVLPQSKVILPDGS